MSLPAIPRSACCHVAASGGPPSADVPRLRPKFVTSLILGCRYKLLQPSARYAPVYASSQRKAALARAAAADSGAASDPAGAVRRAAAAMQASADAAALEFALAQLQVWGVALLRAGKLHAERNFWRGNGLQASGGPSALLQQTNPELHCCLAAGEAGVEACSKAWRGRWRRRRAGPKEAQGSWAG